VYTFFPSSNSLFLHIREKEEKGVGRGFSSISF